MTNCPSEAAARSLAAAEAADRRIAGGAMPGQTAAGETVPFRSLGAIAAEARPLDTARRQRRAVSSGRSAVEAQEASSCDTGRLSPSGLLTESAWKAGLSRGDAGMPSPLGMGGAVDREFAHWVHAEAKCLASRLERMLSPDLERTLARQIRAVAAALWADADWARERIDGRLDDPA